MTTPDTPTPARPSASIEASQPRPDVGGERRLDQVRAFDLWDKQQMASGSEPICAGLTLCVNALDRHNASCPRATR